MTLTAAYAPDEYTATAGQTTFTITFDFGAAADVVVYVNGVLRVDWTISGTSLIFNSGLTVSDNVFITRSNALTQSTDLGVGKALEAETLEEALDKLQRQLQDINDLVRRTPKLGLTRTRVADLNINDFVLPAPDTLTLAASGKKYLSWNDAETDLTLREIAAADDAVGLLSSTLTTSTFAGLPAADTAGRLRYVTDNIRGLFADTGSTWFPVGGYDVNILEFDADATGAADSAAAISAAIAAVDAAGGGTIFFPTGTYKILSTITALASTTDVRLLGTYGGSLINCEVGNTTRAFSMEGSTRLTVEGLVFYTSDDALACQRGFHCATSPTTDLRFLHNELRFFSLGAIQQNNADCQRSWFIGNHIHDIKTANHTGAGVTGTTAAGLRPGGSKVFVLHNFVDDVDSAEDAAGSRGIYQSQPGDDLVYVNNIVQDAAGIKVSPSANNIARVVIANNVLRNVLGADGIEADDQGTGMSHVVIANNVIASSDSITGINIKNGTNTDYLVIGNHLRLTGASSTGIGVNNMTQCTIASNTVEGLPSTGTGIDVVGACTDLRIFNNSVDGGDQGIKTDGIQTRLAISNNDVYNPANQGIHLRDGREVQAVILGNTVRGLASNKVGIHQDNNSGDAGSVTIMNNYIQGASDSNAVNASATKATLVAGNAAEDITTFFGAVNTSLVARDNSYIDLTNVGAEAYAASITPNAQRYESIKIGALTGALTLNAPTWGGAAGRRLVLHTAQDGTGGRVITFNAVYKIPPNIREDRAASAVTSFTFEYDGTDWNLIGGGAQATVAT